MIRFPPTGIALSESDVDCHLREIRVKEQLYAQGFTRQEVQRYYSERHGNINGCDVEDDDVLSTRTATVAAADARDDSALHVKPLVVKGERCISSDQVSNRESSSSENGNSWRKSSHTYPDPVSSPPISVSSSPPVIQSSVPYRHAAVRQSSLLRIMQNAGSQPSTASKSSSSGGSPRNESGIGPVDFLRYPATRTRSYRPRSKTYTYFESEAEPPTPPGHAEDGPGSSPPFMPCSDEPNNMTSGTAEHSPQPAGPLWHPLSVPSSPGTEASSPFVLPPPLSVSRRAFSLQAPLPDRTRSSTLSLSQSHGHSSSPPLLPSASPVNLGIVDRSIIINDLPTAPSTPSTLPALAAASSFQDTSTNTAITRSNTPNHQPFLSKGPPETPTRVPPQTEPRNRHHHHHHGTFGVYKDSLTAEAQPQTPADLESPRRRAVAERNVAYTAPPGQIRTAGILVGGDNDVEPGGMQTPTTRATMMRERRAREFRRWRTARTESLRMRSVESQDDDDDERNAGLEVGVRLDMDGSVAPGLARGGSDGVGRENEEERRLVRAWARFSRERRVRGVDWRDEFDEDRVGEENFDGTDPAERTERGRRTAGPRIVDEEDEER